MSPAPYPWLEDGSNPCGRYRDPDPTDVTVAEHGCDISVAARGDGIGSPQDAELSRIRSGLLGTPGVAVVDVVIDSGPVQAIRPSAHAPKASRMAGVSP
jgi:hypothetical protein